MNVTLVILVIVLVGSIFLIIKAAQDDDFGSEVLGFILAFIAGGWLVIHIIAWSLAQAEFDEFKAKGEALQKTVNISRRSNNTNIERMSILKDVAEWNMDLAKAQARNKYNFYDPFIPDEINDLQPIK